MGRVERVGGRLAAIKWDKMGGMNRKFAINNSVVVREGEEDEGELTDRVSDLIFVERGRKEDGAWPIEASIYLNDLKETKFRETAHQVDMRQKHISPQLLTL